MPHGRISPGKVNAGINAIWNSLTAEKKEYGGIFMIKIGVSGARGRMGQRIIALARQDSTFKVSFGLEADTHPDAGQIIDNLMIASDPAYIENCECLIDFSSPSATANYLSHLVAQKKKAVIGTTGFSREEYAKISQAAKETAILCSPNMSIGVNLLFRLVKESAAVLKGYKTHIEEIHHVHKKDAPSGTAKRIGNILSGLGFPVKDSDIDALRIGEVIGDHKVRFESGVDKIELFHSAKTRDIFAQGALVAAKWLHQKKTGLYTMEDVLFHQDKGKETK
ncbi:MAG: 4-hydroxy-tetrahydrodipicolinate reductase [Candidatus Omnitrophica bacterium]|nr:4-hydroxy-tetrahydrodipicolinate reductase [Candidatus Omnitrophota bacterium]